MSYGAGTRLAKDDYYPRSDLPRRWDGRRV